MPTASEPVQQAVRALGRGRWLLAVSGGTDSAVLLHAAATVLPARSLVVATFNHGTGVWAERASSHVAAVAAHYGLPCVVGRAHGPPAGTEAGWRAARWQFLRECATVARATVATAHTRDDQLETVFIRLLRGTGARGLAGLYAASPVRRPLLALAREVTARYAAEHALQVADDPANRDRRHLRTRVRLDLLPALAAVRPAFPSELLALARSAASWREQIEQVALNFPTMPDHPGPAGSMAFPRHLLRTLPDASLRVLWPALAARAGIVMDRRGTERLASFTIEGETGQSIQLAGHARVVMARAAIALHPRAPGGAPRA